MFGTCVAYRFLDLFLSCKSSLRMASINLKINMKLWHFVNRGLFWRIEDTATLFAACKTKHIQEGIPRVHAAIKPRLRWEEVCNGLALIWVTWISSVLLEKGQDYKLNICDNLDLAVSDCSKSLICFFQTCTVHQWYVWLLMVTLRLSFSPLSFSQTKHSQQYW